MLPQYNVFSFPWPQHNILSIATSLARNGQEQSLLQLYAFAYIQETQVALEDIASHLYSDKTLPEAPT